VWQRITNVLHDRIRVGADRRPTPDRGDHRLPVGAGRRHRALLMAEYDDRARGIDVR
jgi:hypothetical protein